MLIPTEFFYSRAAWQLKFSLLPRRCGISDELIWFSYAYRGRFYIYGLAGDEPVIQERWMTPLEMIIMRMKNKVTHIIV